MEEQRPRENYKSRRQFLPEPAPDLTFCLPCDKWDAEVHCCFKTLSRGHITQNNYKVLEYLPTAGFIS